MKTKLNAVSDAAGRALSFFMTAGRNSDDTGAAALLDYQPTAKWPMVGRNYDARLVRELLIAKGVQLCIVGRLSHNEPARYEQRCKQ